MPLGRVAEYYTSRSYRPVGEISETPTQSAAAGVSYGFALG